ncbi:palindromic element RPE3 domain-containing protein [Rickettsia rhipicephali]|nr:palindromic element RPE3 domain-containing protein [Rickettsia rhipicephali]MCX4079682.1 palindromic element RPE3 domain-containing protein [Rickettsia rhipicephali]
MNLRVSLTQRIKIREHKRILQNSLISSFLKYAVTTLLRNYKNS